MDRVKATQNLIAETKRKFTIFSLAGLLIVLFFSLTALEVQRWEIQAQESIQKIFHITQSQNSLVQQIKVLGDQLEDKIPISKRMLIRAEIRSLAMALDIENKKADEWAKNEAPLLLEELKNSIQLSNITKRLNDFADDAEKFSTEGKWSSQAFKQEISFLNQGAQTKLTDTLRVLSKRMLEANNRSLSKFRRMGYIFVALCILLVFLVWLLVFRPLYGAVISQQTKLVDAVLDIESANRSKMEFLANISHEIRTPMTAIFGYAELLKEDGQIDSVKRDEAVSIILKNASHLLGLIDELLEVSKAESGAMVVQSVSLDLPALLLDVWSLLKVKAEEKEISLEFTLMDEIPRKIISDPKRIKQVLFNVIGNAIKFTESGFVNVKIQFERPDTLLAYIEDSGCGIKLKAQEKLFLPFSQGDSSVSRKYGGTGLGLALSKRIANLLAGDLRLISSQVDKGSTFLFRMKASLPDEIEFISTLEQPISSRKFNLKDTSESIGSKNTLKNRKILIVDDAKENARLFQIYLSSAGAEVLAFNDAKSAIEEVKNGTQFDLILMDLQMPEIDGYTALKELRKLNYTNPVLALTAHAMEEERLKTRMSGFSDHVTKPVNKTRLIAIVESHCGIV
ncbi:MAG: response regulator [Oligoflexia bacterium]|nr:response regulator [Oligoflexia bacterium]